jgi:hypothetical protein
MREQNSRLERKFPATCVFKIKQRKIEGKDVVQTQNLAIVIYVIPEPSAS